MAADELAAVEKDLVDRKVPQRLSDRFFSPLRRLDSKLPAAVWLALVADAYNLTMREDAREDAA